ncbi:MAG: ammonium transporter [Gloeotrichia echinulata GP01]
MSKSKVKKLKPKKSWLSPTWKLCLPLAAMILLVWSYAAVAQTSASPSVDTKDIKNLQVAVDTVWVLFTGCLVFFMNAGFTMVETGFCRHKNAVNVLAQNFIVFALATVAFWATGCAIMFGNSHQSNLFGMTGWFFDGENTPVFNSVKTDVPKAALFFFQLVFADTAATIFTGAVAERIKLIAFFIFSFLLIGIAYPITGHWIWGGGWLSEQHFYDFAGSTVVHSVGGWAALVGAWMLGPRIYKQEADGKWTYRYLEDGRKISFPAHNLSIATLGCLILWLGWFGFNPGSTLKADPNAITHIILTTNMAGAIGGISATFISWRHFGKPDLTFTLNGVLAGLVAITASCAYVTIGSAVIIGLVAGIFVFYSVRFVDNQLKIDDPVGAISVHLVNGIWGTLAVGLFSVGPNVYSWYGDGGLVSPGPMKGLFFGGDFSQLWIQLQGIISVGLFTVVFSYVVWTGIKATVGFRVTHQEEIDGLDKSEHKLEAYPGFAKQEK